MPVKVRKAGNKYKVTTPSLVKSKGTTKKKAEAQKRILNAVEHSKWRPTGKKKKK